MRCTRPSATEISSPHVASQSGQVWKCTDVAIAPRDHIAAAVGVTVDGRTVVDLWGGDAATGRPWQRDTIVNVWSSTKGAVALAAHMLVDRGLLDLDAPVATYWPEFAAAGKDTIPVRYLLSHRAGLCGARDPITIDDLPDWGKVTGILAATEPWWEPGTKSGYH